MIRIKKNILKSINQIFIEDLEVMAVARRLTFFMPKFGLPTSFVTSGLGNP